MIRSWHEPRPTLSHWSPPTRPALRNYRQRLHIRCFPPIDTYTRIHLGNRNSWIKGNHDKMPKHELYVGAYSKYEEIYQSPYSGAGLQLGCLFADREHKIPLCSTDFKVSIS